jgi:transposase-like protein
MSWREVGLDHLRTEFVMLAIEPEVSKSAVGREFGISRKTGYRWLRRDVEPGLTGLVDRSRRPRRSPLQVSGTAVIELVRLRQEHPHRGPKKLRALLVRSGFPSGELPAPATAGRVERDEGAGPAAALGAGRAGCDWGLTDRQAGSILGLPAGVTRHRRESAEEPGTMGAHRRRSR